MANDLAGTLSNITGWIQVHTAIGSLGGFMPVLAGGVEASNHGGTISAEMPALSGSASGLTEVLGHLADEMPSLRGAITAKTGRVADIAGTLPRLSGNLTAQPQRIGRIVGTLPSLGGVLSGSIIPVGQIVGVLPTLSGRLVVLNVVATGTTMCVNLTARVVSEYTNYAFDSFVEYQGQYYGIKDDGIYLLEGADDAGTDITPSLQTGQSTMGKASRKQVPGVYLSGEFDAATITPIMDEDEEGTEVAVTGRAGNETRRAKLPRGASSMYWGFRVTGADAIDSIEVDVVGGTRRIGRFD